MDEVLALLRRAEGLAGAVAQAHLATFGPALHIGGDGAAPAEPRREIDDDRKVPSLVASRGFAPLSAAAPLATCAGLIDAIERLIAAGLPGMFVYLFDEPWVLGAQLGARISAILGRRYEVVEDVWAWRIAPGNGRGWPPHRGIAEPLLARDAPELLNIWVALSDVEVDRACMSFMPLDEDPSYPDDLAALLAPPAAARAVPLAAGSALAWNANILHWGGECAAQAKGPRVSCSFSLARADALAALGVPLADRATRDLRARLDAVARQVAIYGKGQPDVNEAVLAWAEGALALQATIASLSGPLPRPWPPRKAP